MSKPVLQRVNFMYVRSCASCREQFFHDLEFNNQCVFDDEIDTQPWAVETNVLVLNLDRFLRLKLQSREA